VPSLGPAVADAVALSKSSEKRTLGASLSCDARSSMAAEDWAGSVATLLGPDDGLGSLFTLSAMARLSVFSSFEERAARVCVPQVSWCDPGDPAPRIKTVLDVTAKYTTVDNRERRTERIRHW
jgi:hypothetical protein